ncbi:MAG: tocopherol cyclase family protein [Peptostreptococcaceae bacterium]|nr:tocopherol cyclase family protein [Peptostreptococcaceae bacterium]
MRTLVFRGNKNKKNYFEGWYFKFVDDSQDLIIILIPGISIFNEKMAFLQYIIHFKSEVYQGFLKYDIHKFEIQEPFRLSFDHGFISKNRVKLDLDVIKADLILGAFTPLKTSVWNPSIMGFFEYLNMPCFHDVISMNHSVHGKVNIGGKELSFQGKGYIEGDRGKSFPKFYIWAQCNHFKNERTSLFLSVADISSPFLNFLGHIAVLHHEGIEYRFASYLGSKAKVQVSPDRQHAHVSFKSTKHHLMLDIDINQGNSLIAPMHNRMDFKIKEQVRSNIRMDFDGYRDESSFCASELVNWKI